MLGHHLKPGVRWGKRQTALYETTAEQLKIFPIGNNCDDGKWSFSMAEMVTSNVSTTSLWICGLSFLIFFKIKLQQSS